VDLTDAEATAAAMQKADPDLVLHLAAESHVDRSIEGPAAFIDSNVSGTFHLLQAVRAHWEQLPGERQAGFRFHHISTDEVFGSLGATGRFSETTPYDPRSPYSASKAGGAHQLLQQLRPLAVPRKADPALWRSRAMGRTCATGCMWTTTWMPCCWPPAGGSWAAAPAWADLVPMEQPANAPTKRWWRRSATRSTSLLPAGAPHSRLITPVSDRPGHDRRYAIDPTRISTELGWQPRHSFEEGLAATVRWTLEQQGGHRSRKCNSKKDVRGWLSSYLNFTA
jgi:dTDP-glucose 4,6-dehydratase